MSISYVKREIYDVIEGKLISFPHWGISKWCKENNVNIKKLYSLFSNKQSHLLNRYILPQNIHKIYTLVDYCSGEEFNCITNVTIFLHLKCEWNSTKLNLPRFLKSGRCKVATIGGRLLYFKDYGKPPIVGKTQSEILPIVKEQRLKTQLKRIMAHRVRSRFRAALLRAMSQKYTNTFNLVGCNPEELLKHLESKFQNGMSWNNYREWVIDHIKPCISFDLTQIEEQKKCFHYTNLQPLWAKDNSKKAIQDRLLKKFHN